MKQTTNTQASRLHAVLRRITHMHFFLVALLATQIIVYDAWQLIPAEDVLRRWLVTSTLLITTTVVWFLAKRKLDSVPHYQMMLIGLILTDIFVAAANVYMQRGMASRAVFLFVIPIIIAAVFLTRSALFATASLCIAAYTTAAISYFVIHFNEGYKIELYGEVGFYAGMLLITASLLWAILRHKQNR